MMWLALGMVASLIGFIALLVNPSAPSSTCLALATAGLTLGFGGCFGGFIGVACCLAEREDM
jgi:hypothetical protein